MQRLDVFQLPGEPVVIRQARNGPQARAQPEPLVRERGALRGRQQADHDLYSGARAGVLPGRDPLENLARVRPIDRLYAHPLGGVATAEQ
ncbi:MAG: hypothetical protein BGN98_09540 [Microbacterium sp. 69-7]|nr:MAG: hypothetical protein BGN98_09540 [Microbacterium sp. 69-7]